jgi:hypothetical protein
MGVCCFPIARDVPLQNVAIFRDLLSALLDCVVHVALTLGAVVRVWFPTDLPFHYNNIRYFQQGSGEKFIIRSLMICILKFIPLSWYQICLNKNTV